MISAAVGAIDWKSRTLAGSAGLNYDEVMEPTPFKKSSFSGGNGCVEVSISNDGVRVRDTKNRSGAMLSFNAEEWSAFLAGVRNGEFDPPSA